MPLANEPVGDLVAFLAFPVTAPAVESELHEAPLIDLLEDVMPPHDEILSAEATSPSCVARETLLGDGALLIAWSAAQDTAGNFSAAPEVETLASTAQGPDSSDRGRIRAAVTGRLLDRGLSTGYFGIWSNEFGVCGLLALEEVVEAFPEAVLSNGNICPSYLLSWLQRQDRTFLEATYATYSTSELRQLVMQHSAAAREHGFSNDSRPDGEPEPDEPEPDAAAQECDFYELLGVSRTATQPEIKKAYHAKLRATHTDRNKVDTFEKATEKTRKLYDAWHHLGDEDSRRMYDRGGEAGVRNFVRTTSQASPRPEQASQPSPPRPTTSQASPADSQEEVPPWPLVFVVALLMLYLLSLIFQLMIQYTK
jgi:hypothetical protein